MSERGYFSRRVLPGFVLEIGGSTPDLNSILDAIFFLCPRSELASDLELDGCVKDDASIATGLPVWIRRHLDAVGTHVDPVFVAGPDLEVCVTTRTTESLSCAWLHTGRRTITFLASTGKEQESSLPATGRATLATRKDTVAVSLSVQSVLVPVLREAWLDRHLVLLHGAGVLTPEGNGALMLADGGGGKTTTALSMVRRGGRLLGDDLILLDDDGGPSMRGLPEPLNLTQTTMVFFRELVQAAKQGGNLPRGSKTLVLPTDAYGPDVLADRGGLNVVYNVQIDPKGPAARRVKPGEAISMMVRSHLFARGQRVTEFAFDRISSLLSACPFYELRTGPDPAQLGDWLLHHADAVSRGEAG